MRDPSKIPWSPFKTEEDPWRPGEKNVPKAVFPHGLGEPYHEFEFKDEEGGRAPWKKGDYAGPPGGMFGRPLDPDDPADDVHRARQKADWDRETDNLELEREIYAPPTPMGWKKGVGRAPMSETWPAITPGAFDTGPEEVLGEFQFADEPGLENFLDDEGFGVGGPSIFPITPEDRGLLRGSREAPALQKRFQELSKMIRPSPREDLGWGEEEYEDYYKNLRLSDPDLWNIHQRILRHRAGLEPEPEQPHNPEWQGGGQEALDYDVEPFTAPPNANIRLFDVPAPSPAFPAAPAAPAAVAPTPKNPRTNASNYDERSQNTHKALLETLNAIDADLGTESFPMDLNNWNKLKESNQHRPYIGPPELKDSREYYSTD